MFNIFFDAWSSLALPWSGAPAQCISGSRFSHGLDENGERALHYRLFIPGDERGPMPLIVMLHGCGQDAADFAAGTGMNALAEKQGCLVLYPEQSCSAHYNKCWNWYDRAHHRRGEGEPALIAGLTRRIMAEHAVDPGRVAVAGLSAGGAMAVILGRTYPDLFSAVGCHSGLAHGSAGSDAGALLAMRTGAAAPAPVASSAHAAASVIVFHGDADATVHRMNSGGVIRQFLDSHALHRRAVDAGVAVEAETGRSGGRAFTRHVHRERSGGIVAEEWTVHGAGHAWSGGDARGSYTDALGPNASQEMLRFFIGSMDA
ncbi:PHB depolymerase family esterase [Massilia sp. CFBP9026]|uniref:extracellular catalytic domain type 1 short-chain-length polyhydroxyalkanoate depolymerase n=1 Tax=Massilia sp. CFBP9026 TaxID=3096536 RepID=UPI002A6AD214|nr:PHB depolymerase family esterase [Massilia sp. CFBP9026]MDY0960634.1 PHB depolymerase family esterase [Massilia sp. CFBP9026]